MSEWIWYSSCIAFVGLCLVALFWQKLATPEEKFSVGQLRSALHKTIRGTPEAFFHSDAFLAVTNLRIAKIPWRHLLFHADHACLKVWTDHGKVPSEVPLVTIPLKDLAPPRFIEGLELRCLIESDRDKGLVVGKLLLAELRSKVSRRTDRFIVLEWNEGSDKPKFIILHVMRGLFDSTNKKADHCFEYLLSIAQRV